MAGATMGPGQETNLERGMGRAGMRGDAAQALRWTQAGAVHGPLAQQDTDVLHERELATVADPLPLGLASFASATFTSSAIYAGWFRFSLGDLDALIGVALIFGGIAQFLAGMWAFRRGNVLAATAFGTFGAFNAAFAVYLRLLMTQVIPLTSLSNPADPFVVAGIFVLTVALIALYLGVAALGEQIWFAAILFSVALAYCFEGIAFFVSARWVAMVGGYAGIVSACLAFLLSAAIVINCAFRRALIPTFAAPSVSGMQPRANAP
jgi:succinate-acetate transporter protein